VIQAGSFDADNTWRPTHKPIILESGNGLSNKRGMVAMAREDKPASATAEFYINLADYNATGLDPKPGEAPGTTGYAVFGQVTSGMEVADAIAAVPLFAKKGPSPGAFPKTPVIIKKVSIVVTADVVPAVPVVAPAAPVVPGN
jgi:cyclophilin family peptidyl-prolyl cis-trans isomerase